MVQATNIKQASASGGRSLKTVDVIIETPRGSRNKFKYDEKRQMFKLKSVLPIGAAFPYDFGFIPETKADDGDPIDVLVLMDEPTFTGCLIVKRMRGSKTARRLLRNARVRRK